MKTYARIDSQHVAEIVSLNVKPETLYHPSMVWVDITDQAPPPEVNDLYSDGLFTAPVMKNEDVVFLARSRLAAEMETANQTIAPLQDAVDLGIATVEETARLAEWRKYRVMLSRTDVTDATTIDWPVIPA
jgi:hypothetical protein